VDHHRGFARRGLRGSIGIPSSSLVHDDNAIESKTSPYVNPMVQLKICLFVALFVRQWLSGAAGAESVATPLFEEQVLFKAGEGGYYCYRIPALVATNRGTLLAFCEARKRNCNDHGDIDLVMRRSRDGGRTWDKARVVADEGTHTAGNPCPVVERRSGTIWLPFCCDNKRVLLMKSTDEGQTWSQPVEIAKYVVHPAWHWVGTGPGHGIQLSSGRLLIPCWADATPNLGEAQLSYVFYSDDQGDTWKLGGAMDRDASDECEVVERSDGTLYANMRSRRGKNQRAYATSKDGGTTWSAVQYDAQLTEPSCQGSLVRLTDQRNNDKDRVLLATPASPSRRAQMTVRLSYDECRTWPVAKVVHNGSAAYSDLAVSHGLNGLLLYEADDYSKINLARFNVQWLTDGKDHVGKKAE